jgi:hypothetical protein
MTRLGPLACLLTILAALCSLTVPDARADEPPLMRLVEPPQEEASVVNLTLDRYSIGENFIIFPEKNKLLVPLSGVMTALEVAITADPDAGTASGFFINDNRKFALDLTTGTATFDGKTFALEPGTVERQVTDIYIDTALLTKWFGIRFHLDTEDLTLVVSSAELLPVQERLDRERRRSGVRRRGEADPYNLVEAPSKWVDWPFVDTSIQYSTARTNGQTTDLGQYSSVVTGMVGGLDLDMSVNGTVPSQSNQEFLRATLGQRDPRGGLLGPLDASEFAVGDVSSPTLPLVSDSVAGRGAMVSTLPLHRLSDLQRVTLRGDLPVGWQIELYRGGDLIDFQTSSNDGRYEFDNVPTIPGLNAFKLVFYGPEGQRREEEQPIFVAAASVDAGQFGYSLLANQQNTDLLGNHPNNNQINTTAFSRFDQLTRNQLLSQPNLNSGTLLAAGEAEYGLSDTASLNGAVSSQQVAGVQSEYFQTGLRTSLLGALTTLDTATSTTGGVAAGAGVQSQTGGIAWQLSHDNFLGHFVSERSFDPILDQPLASLSTAQINGLLPTFGLGRLPFNATASYGEANNGATDLQLSERLSSYIDRFTVGAETQAHLVTNQPTQTVEIFRVGTQFGKVGLRGEALYNVTPTAELTAVQLTSDFAVRPNWNLRLGITQLQTPPQETQLTTGAAFLLKNLALGVDTSVSNRGDFSVLFKISFSFGMEPRNDSPVFRGESFARSGAISPVAFLDRNGDGVFGPGDVPLPDVRFRTDNAPLRGQTDQTGSTLITGLEPYRETPVAIDVESLEDPFWKPADQKIAVLPRPGSVVQLSFPVYETGAIDGTVEIDRGGQRVPLPGVRVQAFDANGKVAAETISGYDGFFFLEAVRLGRYVLRVDPDQLVRLHLAAPEPQAIALSLDKPTISAGMITLTRVPAAAPAPGAAVSEPKTHD